VGSSVFLRMAWPSAPGNLPVMNDLAHAAVRAGMRTPLVRTYIQHIDESPEAVFPLLCPVREREWLEGWAESCELLWSASGVAEPGCVFRTTEEGRPETVWIITEHDPDQGVIVFARVTPGLAASTLRIEVGGAGGGSSAVAIRYAVIPTSLEGERYAAERYDRADLLASVVWWERSMNHFVVTGELLRRHQPILSSKNRVDGVEATDKE
jgi:hypothetical protein